MSHSYSLCKAVTASAAHISFHTPGHKFRSEFINGLSAADTTELSVTDELYTPTGPLKQAEAEAARAFGVGSAYFSAGGATLCIQTALAFYAGKKLLTERSCHISVINACALLGIDVDFVFSEAEKSFGFTLPATPASIEKLLKTGAYAALLITSPCYYGPCAELHAIKELCIKYGTELIIDASHGSHLSAMFTAESDKNPLNCGDFIIYSLHKTLPVMTGGAILCVNKPVSEHSVKKRMAMFGSTSPSFAILASIDYGVGWYDSHKAQFAVTAEKTAALSAKLENIGCHVLKTDKGDPLRLCIDTFPLGYTAEEAAERLAEFNCYPELAKKNRLLLLFSPFNTEDDYNTVIKALSSLRKRQPLPCIDIPVNTQKKRAVSVRNAMMAETETLPTDKAVGRISAETYAVCPPGIPVIAAGEIIDKEAAELLSSTKKFTEVIRTDG